MRNNKLFDRVVEFNVLDKQRATSYYTERLLNKTAQIFEYRNLPESIPEDVLEMYLQENGNVLFHEVNGELYVFTGGLGGEPDVYYRPTIYTVANPALKYSKGVKIGEEGVMVKNDTKMQGLIPIILKFAWAITEIMISFRSGIINTRDANAISAGDDKTEKGAKAYMEQIEKGKLAVIAESQLLEGVRRHPTTENSNLNQLRETYQFLESKLYAELGIKSSHNMKRQYVSDEENISNDDTLLPLIDNMLANRQRGIEEVNEMFGTNIEVGLRGTWELQFEELQTAIKIAEDPMGLDGNISPDMHPEEVIEENEEQESPETVEAVEGTPGISEEAEEGYQEENTHEEADVEETDEEESTSEETDDKDVKDDESIYNEDDSEGTTEEESAEDGTDDIDIEVNIINGDDSIIVEDETDPEPESEPEPEPEEDEEGTE